MPQLASAHFARAVDHTLLDAMATGDAIDALCDQAVARGFAAVCVYPHWVERCARRLDGAVGVCAVVSFPHGLDVTAVKCEAARRGLAGGATELDVVIRYGPLADGDSAAAAGDLTAVVEAARRESAGAVVKAIVEAPLLNTRQLREACRVVAGSGADFAKSGSGWAGPVTVGQVAGMRSTLPGGVRIKAAGGIRTADQAVALIEAGADRIGTSSALAMLEELEARVGA